MTLDELRRMGRDPAEASKFVGVIEGLEKLSLDTRSRWRVANPQSSQNWYPLLDVVGRIEASIAP